MTEQELTDEMANLQQKRLDLAAQLDQMTLQLQLWDEHISLLQKMLVMLQTQGEQEEKLLQVIVKEAQLVTPVLSVIKTTRPLGV